MARQRLNELSDTSIKGLCEWACAKAKLPFSKLGPEMVTITFSDGRQCTVEDDPANFGLAGKVDTEGKIVSLTINHPDATGPITVDIGDRQ